MIKKITLGLSILLTLCLMMLPAKAAGSSSSTTSAEGYRGDVVTLTVSVPTTNVKSGGVEFEYDTNSFDIIEGTPGNALVSAFMKPWDGNKEKLTFAYNTATDISGDLITVKVKIKDTAAFGKLEIKVNTILNDGVNNRPMDMNNGSGYITVKCNHSYTAEVVDAKYLKSEATCTKKAVYYKSCVHCGEKGTENFETGSTAEHKYDQKVVKEAYLASAADCKNKAKYYYSCTCGAKGSETFETGSAASHNYTKKIETTEFLKNEADCENAKTYYYACSGCDVKGTTTYTVGEKLGHTGGAATCTSKAVCDRCNKEYGEKLPHNHNQKVESATYLKNEASCQTPKTYYYSCLCGDKGTETFTVGEKTAHSFTKQVENYKYTATYGSCTKKATYYYSCECGEKGTETFESKVAPSHTYETEWTSDGNKHWKECKYCTAKINEAAHTKGAAATETNPQKCTVCDYIIQAALGHTHKYETTYTYDSKNHWYACSGCSELKDVAAHIFDNECDATCNECGYTRNVNHEYGEWQIDANKHWHECTKCHEVPDEAAHTPGAEATEDAPQTCTVCEYVIKEAISHTHSYTQKYDSMNHWEECTCGAKENFETHKFDEGKVLEYPNEEEEGSKVYKCECGYEKIEVLPKLEKESGCKKGCKKDLGVLVVSVISLATIGVLLKKREN